MPSTIEVGLLHGKEEENCNDAAKDGRDIEDPLPGGTDFNEAADDWRCEITSYKSHGVDALEKKRISISEAVPARSRLEKAMFDD